MEENVGKKDVVVKTIELSAEQQDKIQEIADKTNKTFNRVFNEIIENSLAKLERKK